MVYRIKPSFYLFTQNPHFHTELTRKLSCCVCRTWIAITTITRWFSILGSMALCTLWHIAFKIQGFCCHYSTIQFDWLQHDIFPFGQKQCIFNGTALSHSSSESQEPEPLASFMTDVHSLIPFTLCLLCFTLTSHTHSLHLPEFLVWAFTIFLLPSEVLLATVTQSILIKCPSLLNVTFQYPFLDLSHPYLLHSDQIPQASKYSPKIPTFRSGVLHNSLTSSFISIL